MAAHSGRAHSQFSASGADRWFNCPGSVELSEGRPDKTSFYSLEGTKAHEVLETILTVSIAAGAHRVFYPKMDKKIPREMIVHGTHAANLILGNWGSNPNSEIMIETRVYLDFIHPKMFGTFDGAVIDTFGTLHVYDYKYGQGHSVSPKENLQMIFYAIGLAHKYNWNFKRVRMWIIQPRIKGYDGPVFWEIPTMELKRYVPKFEEAVARVLDKPKEYAEGSWCHWCKAKSVCPLKNEGRLDEAKRIFQTPAEPERDFLSGFEKEGNEEGSEESFEEESKKESLQSEGDWRKKARAKKRGRKAARRSHGTIGDFY